MLYLYRVLVMSAPSRPYQKQRKDKAKEKASWKKAKEKASWKNHGKSFHFRYISLLVAVIKISYGYSKPRTNLWSALLGKKPETFCITARIVWKLFPWTLKLQCLNQVLSFWSNAGSPKSEKKGLLLDSPLFSQLWFRFFPRPPRKRSSSSITIDSVRS